MYHPCESCGKLNDNWHWTPVCADCWKSQQDRQRRLVISLAALGAAVMAASLLLRLFAYLGAG